MITHNAENWSLLASLYSVMTGLYFVMKAVMTGLYYVLKMTGLSPTP
jgi:hypothetical protein